MKGRGEASTTTDYPVACKGLLEDPCNAGAPIFLTKEEYHRQLALPASAWKCPRCRGDAEFIFGKA